MGGDLLVGPAGAEHLGDGLGLLEEVEVAAVEVLGEEEEAGGLVVDLVDHHRHLGEAGGLG